MSEPSADVYVNPEFVRLFASAERFEDWPQAFDAAVERQRPIIARVGGEIAKCFPSRAGHTLFAAEFSAEGGSNG